ncbi:hypothetical protein IscW_ISCW019813, partial [Ixodes scapularis]
KGATGAPTRTLGNEIRFTLGLSRRHSAVLYESTNANREVKTGYEREREKTRRDVKESERKLDEENDAC